MNSGDRERRLSWEGCLNVRDLGGYPTADGRETRWEAVVRSDDPSLLDETGRDALVAYGVKTILDLRTPEELRANTSPFVELDERGIGSARLPAGPVGRPG